MAAFKFRNQCVPASSGKARSMIDPNCKVCLGIGWVCEKAGITPPAPRPFAPHRCARAKEGGSDCHSSMRQRNCCADGPLPTLFKTEKSSRSAGPQKRTKAPRCKLTRGARGCEPAPRTPLLLSHGTELSLAWPCPVGPGRVYAQIMVKMGHLRPAVMGNGARA